MFSTALAIQDIYQECEQIAQKAQTGQATSLEMSDRSDKIRQSAINSQQQMQEKTASMLALSAKSVV